MTVSYFAASYHLLFADVMELRAASSLVPAVVASSLHSTFCLVFMLLLSPVGTRVALLRALLVDSVGGGILVSLIRATAPPPQV